MPRMMIVLSDDTLHKLAPFARLRAAAGGIDLSRAYRLEAARLLAEKLEEVTCGREGECSDSEAGGRASSGGGA